MIDLSAHLAETEALLRQPVMMNAQSAYVHTELCRHADALRYLMELGPLDHLPNAIALIQNEAGHA